MLLRVLTWNLLHGRAVPPAGRDLFDDFAAVLRGWEWDVALLQEVPPWWPPQLCDRLGAQGRVVLTSRNFLLPVRRAIAVRWPDLIKSNGGGANVILVRWDAIDEHRWRRLRVWPERRWVHAVRLHHAGVWVGNLHAQGAPRDVRLAAANLLRWAGSRPAVLGGDFNLRDPRLAGFDYAGGHGVDLVFARGLAAQPGATAEPGGIPEPGATAQPGATEVLDSGRLSDHAPVRVTVRIARARAPRPPATPSP